MADISQSPLDRAIDDLRSSFRQPEILSPVTFRARNQDQTSSTSDPELDRKLIRFIFGSDRGSHTVPEIIEQITGLVSDSDDVADVGSVPLVIYSGKKDDNVFNIEPKTTLQDVVGKIGGDDHPEGDVSNKFQTRLSSLHVMDTSLSPGSRDLEAVELFFNSIPTVQMSLCQPYLSVQLITGRPGVNEDGRATSPTLFKFLEGASKVSEGSADFDLAGGRSETETVSIGGRDVELFQNVTGMEMFTSPQTLINPERDANENDLRATPVIDQFRPFMSLDKFRIDVQSANAGMISYKTAVLDITLHDRSRLAEIADLISPDLYAQTELLIEYGWSHPHGDDETNPYGVFLNALRKKEKYRVRNSRYKFDEVGQVKLTLDLYLIGAPELDINRISQGESIDTRVQEQIREAINTIKRSLRELTGDDSSTKNKAIQDVLNSQFLYGINDVQSLPNPGKDVRDLVKKLNRLSGRSGPLRDLRDSLKTLYEDGDGRGGLFATEILKSINDALNEKLKLISGESVSPDPFLGLSDRFHPGEGDEVASSETDSGNISLAKIIHLFVGKPLAASGRFNEVQFIFHPFNSRSGAMGETKIDGRKVPPRNIGEFEIPISDFRAAIKILARDRRSANIPLSDFIYFVGNEFIDDISSHNYGLQSIYRSVRDKDGNLNVKTIDKDLKDKALEARVESEIRNLGIEDGVFRSPLVGFHLECHPRQGAEQGVFRGEESSDTILKIHVFDRVASPFDGAINVLEAASNGFLQSVYPGSNEETLRILRDPTNEEEKRMEEVRENVGDEEVYGIEADRSIVIDAIRRTVPTITYGTNASVITNAQLQTETMPEMSTIHMLQSGPSGNHVKPQGFGVDGIPLRLIPASLSMSTMGCPLLEYAQQFFIVFQDRNQPGQFVCRNSD